MKLLTDFTQLCTSVTSLAEGGQKKVLAAEHPTFGSIVIKYGEYRYATSLERITREVGLLRELNSRYYPRHYEFLVEPVNKEFLIAEERLDAVELTTARDRFTTDAQIQELLKHLIYALNILWRQNVIHRDIKPANILITSDGEPRIIDLGIARFLDYKTLTAEMAMRGPATPFYAAPEQLANRKSMINVRTDFFLLGLLILELMHGFHPFDPNRVGNQQRLVDNIREGLYVPPDPKHDARLRSFVQTALEPQPYKRFRTVGQLMQHLGIEEETC